MLLGGGWAQVGEFTSLIAVQNATCQWKSSSLYQEDKVTEKLNKLWAPEIYLECYCAAREAQPIRGGNTKPRAAMVMALWPARMPWSSMYSRNTMNIPKIFQVFMVLLVWQQEPRNRSFPGLSPVDWGGTWIQALSNSLMYCLLFRLFPNPRKCRGWILHWIRSHFFWMKNFHSLVSCISLNNLKALKPVAPSTLQSLKSLGL